MRRRAASAGRGRADTDHPRSDLDERRSVARGPTDLEPRLADAEPSCDLLSLQEIVVVARLVGELLGPLVEVMTKSTKRSLCSGASGHKKRTADAQLRLAIPAS